MGSRQPSVWIDDPNLIFRRGLASCLAAEGFVVAGESAGFEPPPKLDGVSVLLFDIEASGMQRAVDARHNGTTRLVGMTRSASEESLFDAIQAGLCGFLVRSELTPGSLVACLMAVSNGHGALPSDLTARLVTVMAKGGKRGASAGHLATREIDVLRLLADGEDTRAIAAKLSYSERTVKNIVHDVLMKTNCKTRAQAVAVATRQGFI